MIAQYQHTQNDPHHLSVYIVRMFSCTVCGFSFIYATCNTRMNICDMVNMLYLHQNLYIEYLNNVMILKICICIGIEAFLKIFNFFHSKRAMGLNEHLGISDSILTSGHICISARLSWEEININNGIGKLYSNATAKKTQLYTYTRHENYTKFYLYPSFPFLYKNIQSNRYQCLFVCLCVCLGFCTSQEFFTRPLSHEGSTVCYTYCEQNICS